MDEKKPDTMLQIPIALRTTPVLSGTVKDGKPSDNTILANISQDAVVDYEWTGTDGKKRRETLAVHIGGNVLVKRKLDGAAPPKPKAK